MVKVSVIIPVYNVEKYLEACLNSIINQTLTDIEIICVNDGSSDNSLEILKKFAQNDSRMTIISQKNRGHAVATNLGINRARGKYLFLMDSDDILKYNALELTYNIAEETHVDFVLFKAINYDNQKNEYYQTKSYGMDEVYERVKNNVFNYKDVDDLIFTISVTPWSKLYNRQFIQENNIMFPEGLIFDDNVFFWDVLFSAKKIVFLNEFLFIRRYHTSSSTNRGDLRFLDSIKINDLIWDRFDKYNQFETHKNRLFNNKILSLYNRYTKIMPEYKDIFFKEMKKSYMKLLENETLFDEVMQSLTDNNKKIFVQVISTENSDDFELLRNMYGSITKSSGEK